MEKTLKTENKRIRIIHTLPRCGTHFIWSRMVESGNYQLIYDADILPALTVLAGVYEGKVTCMYSEYRNPNPNYSFTYNSLDMNEPPQSARRHLEKLSKKYSAAPGLELFKKIMSLQDNGDKCLFSVNRFVYNVSFGPYANCHYLFKDFKWTIDHALEALKLMVSWYKQAGYDPEYVLVIRDIPEWIKSFLLYRGESVKDVMIERINNLPKVLSVYQELGIPVFWMKETIDTINKGNLDFEKTLTPFTAKTIEEIKNNLDDYRSTVKEFVPKNSFRVLRFFQYLMEKDPIKRISLVRSIGEYPKIIGKRLPYFGKRLKQDLFNNTLNNAKIKDINRP